MADSADVKDVKARQTQSKKSKAATLDMLKGKNRATAKFSIYLPDDQGDGQEVELTFRAIGSAEYDRIVSKYPPTAEQRAEGSSFNLDTFAPALIAAVSLEPPLSLEDAQEIWTSEEWSRGEVVTLWRRALELCNRGLDIPFTASV